MKARTIELDILAGHFDETLQKYKPQFILSVASPDITPKVTPKMTELWQRYTEARQTGKSPATIRMYGWVANHLGKLPEIKYRNPYQTRHTFCSLCREVDIASIQIAKWVGNSPQMIDRIYAKPTDHIQVPNL